jgi:hypothetical protein
MEDLLPIDVLFHVMVSADLHTLLAMRLACSLFLDLATHKSLWLERIHRHLSRSSLVTHGHGTHWWPPGFASWYRLELMSATKTALELMFGQGSVADAPDGLDIQYQPLNKNDDDDVSIIRDGDHVCFVNRQTVAPFHGIVCGKDVVRMHSNTGYRRDDLAGLVSGSEFYFRVRPRDPSWRPNYALCVQRMCRLSDPDQIQLPRSNEWTNQSFVLFCQTGCYTADPTVLGQVFPRPDWNCLQSPNSQRG